MHRECSTDYHFIVLRSFLGAIANARRAGLTVPDRRCSTGSGGPAISRCTSSARTASTPALSDGDQGDFRDLLAVAADLLARPELGWAATAGRRGTPPARRMVSFPVGGYYVQRSGWGDRDRPYAHERWGVFDCGPIGDGGHGHYDQLSVELMAGGHRLVVDPGRYTYADGARRLAAVVQGHGRAQHGLRRRPGPDARIRRGKPKGPTSRPRGCSAGRLRAGLDVLRGEVRSPRYDAVHTRTLALVDDDYWVVHDRLRAPTPHSYEARWHLAPAAHGRDRGQLRRRSGLGRGARRRLVVPAGFGSVGLETGWVSPTYGVKLPGAGRRSPTTGVADADLVTVLVAGRRATSRVFAQHPRPDRLEVAGQAARSTGVRCGGPATADRRTGAAAMLSAVAERDRGAYGFAPDPALPARDTPAGPARGPRRTRRG